MGKRGPKPTPSPILRLRGSWLVNTRQDEPKTTPELVKCPSWVTRATAKKHWADISTMLFGLNILADVHSASLSLLVEALTDWIELSEAVKSEPLTVTTVQGVKENPVYRMKDRAWERVLKACREFGMTPSAISGVKATRKPLRPGLEAFRLAK